MYIPRDGVGYKNNLAERAGKAISRHRVRRRKNLYDFFACKGDDERLSNAVLSLEIERYRRKK